MLIKLLEDGEHKLIVPSTSNYLDQITGNWFSSSFWKNQNRIAGGSQGRRTAWFIEPENQDTSNAFGNQWVLRHYYRGGLIAKVIDDKFFYTGIQRTRCFQEVSLLLKMIELGLPVPKPVGARITRKGLFYQSDLLMQKIDAKDLVSYLKEQPLRNEQWREIGKIIAKFHFYGIYHSDLNSHNILIRVDKDQSIEVFIIDFDRCEQRAVESKNHEKSSWKKSNLSRLHRSLTKEKQLSPEVNFSEENWLEMIKGYC